MKIKNQKLSIKKSHSDKDLIFKSFHLSILIFFILQFSFFSLNCNNKPTPPDNYIPSINIELDELGVTEVWLKIKFTSTDVPKGFAIKRNGNTIAYVPNSHSDTVLIDTDLLPKQIYFYRAYKMLDNKIIDSSSLLPVTTMDTTSHEITWVIDTLGGIQSRVTGLWGTDKNNVYAVGRFHDTGLTPRLAHWNSNKWTYLRPDAINGWDGIAAGELTNVFGILPNKIWVVGYGFTQQWGRDSTWGFVAEWNGQDWKRMSPNAPSEQFISIWASSENDVWITTMTGFVYHYNGSTWEKLTTGTTYDFSDIWGFSKNEIYITGFPLNYSTGIVLKYNGQTWVRENVLPINSIVSFKSIWGMNSKFLYVASDGGLFTNKQSVWVESLFPGRDVATEKVRGTQKNNVFVSGHFGKILHFNGYSWKNYETQFGGSELWVLGSIQAFENDVFIGGSGGVGFERKGLVLRGRR
jgi:hypothetical protein